MDFIRAAIKGLFYDMPLASAVQTVISGDKDILVARLGEILRWREQAFTMTEIGILTAMVRENWLKYNLQGREIRQSEITRCFVILNHFSDKIIDDTDSEPIVRFENLLRWHEITQYVGENLFTTSYLAERDTILNRKRNSFVWPDVLRHDEKELNILLNGGLSDVHAHLLASNDIFGSNWISIMNHVAFAEPRRKGGTVVSEVQSPYQEYDIQTMDEASELSLHDWGIVAARIRVGIYMTLFHQKPFPYRLLTKMIASKKDCIDAFNDTITEIGAACDAPLRLPEGSVFDYAISQKTILSLTEIDRRSPWMMHWGERALMYHFFLRYYGQDKEAAGMAPWFYLYTLIKIKYRRELIQTNPLLGLENFQQYEHRKGRFIHGANNMKLAYKYAVQTSIGKEGKNLFEARISPGHVKKLRSINYRTSIFDERSFYLKEDSNMLSFVVHFLKERPDDSIVDFKCRHMKLRNSLQKSMQMVLADFRKNQQALKTNKPLLVGIDAAGAELNCRPEVFAPFFRWARLEGVRNVTYHAGEDFYDIIDGIRSVDETVLFMQYTNGCRIGHGLALGVDAKRYYERRHFHTILPKQVLLDNLVWLSYKSKSHNVILEPSTQDFIEKTVMRLLGEIGYGEDVNLYRYWQSMLLRGDRIKLKDDVNIAAYDLASECHVECCDEARKSKTARELHLKYETEKTIVEKGNKPCVFLLPKGFYKDAEKMQVALIKELAAKNICIESNPSSNIKIGPFNKYDELPLLKFFCVKFSGEPTLSVSVNTDDKGLFATSLANEYSLVAAALQKQRNHKGERLYDNQEIYAYIGKLIENGHHQRFLSGN